MSAYKKADGPRGFGGFKDVDPEKCAASITKGEARFFKSQVQCSKKGIYDEDGHKWCGVHAPSKIEERDQKRRDKWADESARAALAAQIAPLEKAARMLREHGREPAAVACDEVALEIRAEART